MSVQEALDSIDQGGREGGKKKRSTVRGDNSTKEDRAEVRRLMRLYDTERILKKTGKKDSLRREKARIWELIEEAFNANRSVENRFTIEQMQGQYKRYRLEKKKKFDQGLVNSQESGYSLIETADPMPNPLPAAPSDNEDGNLGTPERYYSFDIHWKQSLISWISQIKVNPAQSLT